MSELLYSSALHNWLKVRTEIIRTASVVSLCLLVVGVVLFMALSDHVKNSPLFAFLFMVFFVMPALISITADLYLTVLNQDFNSSSKHLRGATVRQVIAWSHTMLVACLGFWLLCFAGLGAVLFRRRR